MVLNWAGASGSSVISSPALVNGVVYVGSWDGKLYAFNGAGSAGCSGQPTTCPPLWTANAGGAVTSSPGVVDLGGGQRVVFVGSEDHKVYAFDAAGNTNCSGNPKVCRPLWTATTGNVVRSSPVVANGVVYIGSFDNKVYAFDAAGNTNCSGNPKACTPLWTAATGGGLFSTPAVAGGVVYIGSQDHKVYAFDAAGNTNCSGNPKACTPLWTATTGGLVNSSPTVGPDLGGGARVIYVGSDDANLYAFGSLANTNGCPTNCAPLWTGPTGGAVLSSPAFADFGGSQQVVYVGSDDHKLYAFDAGGRDNCSGEPTVCGPQWSGSTGGAVESSPAVANGIVYVGSRDVKLYAFDAEGTLNCTGRTCTPLWTTATGDYVDSSPAVGDGVIYVGSRDKRLYAFGLEKIPPTTTLVVPRNGDIVSSTTSLGANASDDVKVSKVEFHLTGGNYNDKLIALGTPFGSPQWIANWDTTTVPNGAYTITSVAYDPAGNVGRSSDAHITVRN
jgi:outer membrane protein assembly factor BamB